MTTTTHKSLRGPRGGMILTNDEDIAKKINSAVFPGLQGGPLMHVIAAKAVAFGEALKPEFKDYAAQVVDNARALADQLMKGGLDIVSGGTDNHLMLVDLRPKNVTGKAPRPRLAAPISPATRTACPFDPEKPFVTSGIRLGTPAGTTRGFGEAEFREIGRLDRRGRSTASPPTARTATPRSRPASATRSRNSAKGSPSIRGCEFRKAPKRGESPRDGGGFLLFGPACFGSPSDISGSFSFRTSWSWSIRPPQRAGVDAVFHHIDERERPMHDPDAPASPGGQRHAHRVRARLRATHKPR